MSLLVRAVFLTPPPISPLHKRPTMITDEVPYWYVLRDLRRANAKRPAYLDLEEGPYGLEHKVFVPMRQRVILRGGKRVIETVPFMTDLIFVHESREVLDPIIHVLPTLQYRFARGCRQNDPMKVRNEEMEQFIRAVHSHRDVRYFTPDEVSPLLYGKNIRIIGGTLDGYEGRLMSKRGSKTRRLIIQIEGLIAAAIEVEPQFVQLIPD